jgi:hypothetical protein
LIIQQTRRKEDASEKMSERGRKGKAGGGPAKQERADIWMGRARVRERVTWRDM